MIIFKRSIYLYISLLIILTWSSVINTFAVIETISVTAEGVSDPESDLYKKDKGLMIDHLRQDARRQVIEKALGCFVSSETLIENYGLIKDRIITKSKGLIREITDEEGPWLGKDGFMHLRIKAKVVLSEVKEALGQLSKTERVQLIKEAGNPRIDVAVSILRSADQERSMIAENILKEKITGFGYRVWSLELGAKRKSDFSISGIAKVDSGILTSRYTGLSMDIVQLTSWTIKCVSNDTGEEIYFNNKVPKGAGWGNEDKAIAAIGMLIGEEFNLGFFDDYLLKPSRIVQCEITGLPDYDAASVVQNEFIGLRQILNAELSDFDDEGICLYEIEITDTGKNLMKLMNGVVIKPLNGKLGYKGFKLKSARGMVVKIHVQPQGDGDFSESLESKPPASQM